MPFGMYSFEMSDGVLDPYVKRRCGGQTLSQNMQLLPTYKKDDL